MIYQITKAPPLNTAQLTDELTTAGLPAPTFIDSEDSTLSLTFSGTLDSGQQTTLASVVAAHTPTPGYVTLATRAAIATLTAYVNNADPAIAGTARAVMISYIAPNLPPGLLITINAAIAAKLSP